MTKRTALSWLAAAAGWTWSDAALLACPVCFRIDDGPTTAGVRAAVVVLVGVTASVLCGFAFFIGRFLARTRRMARPDAEPF